MLKPAISYEQQLSNLFNKVLFDDKFRFYNASNYYDYGIELDKSSWQRLEFVSVDDKDNVRGFLSAKIDRTAESISSLKIINFYDMNYTFSHDFHQFLTDLFMKFKFRKICFAVVVGNPAEKMYDKYISKYGGRVVGTYKYDVRLYDGIYYDLKCYEIFKGEFESKLNKGR